MQRHYAHNELDQLNQDIRNRLDAMRDIIVEPREGMAFCMLDDRLVVSVRGVEGFEASMPLEDLAYGQSCTWLSVPKRYADRCAATLPNLLLRNLNDWREIADHKRLLRLRDVNGSYFVRANVSNRYLRFDHNQMYALIMACVLESHEASENLRVSMDFDGDDMFVYSPMNIPVQTHGDATWHIGMFMSNSEVGRSSIGIMPLITRVDGNIRLIMPTRIAEAWSRRHVRSPIETVSVLPDVDLRANEIAGDASELIIDLAENVDTHFIERVINGSMTQPVERFDLMGFARCLRQFTLIDVEMIRSVFASQAAELPPEHLNTRYHAACALSAYGSTSESSSVEALMSGYAWSIISMSARTFAQYFEGDVDGDYVV